MESKRARAKRAREMSSILNSGSLVAVGFLISGALSIITRIVLARFLEPSGYGLISEGLAALSILTVLSVLGTEAGVSRFMSRNEEHKNLVESALTLVLPLSFIFTAISLANLNLITSVFNEPTLLPVLKALFLNVPSAAALSIFIGGFRGHEETFQKVLISMLLLPGLILVLSSSLILIYETPAMAAYGYTLAGWLSTIISGIWYFTRFGASRPSIKEIKSLVKFSLPLGFKSILNYGVNWSSIILIGYILGSSATGLFNAAYPISYGILAGLTSINYLFMPVISRMHSNSNLESIKGIYSSMTRWLLICTLPFALIMSLKSYHIMNLLFGNSYSSASLLLSLLIVGQFVKVLFGPLGNILIAIGKTKKEALAKLYSLSILIISSIPLISSIGLAGAAIGFILGSLTGELVRLYYCRKTTSFNPFKHISWKILGAGIVSTIILIPRSSLLVSILQISLSFGAYLIFIILYGVIEEEDIEVLENFLKESLIPKKIWSYPFRLLENFSLS